MAHAHLLDLPLDALLARARRVRDEATGTRVTYSPKVFIPLTMLCRDRCGYCTFAQPPARLDKVVPVPRRRAGHRVGGRPGRVPRGAVHAGRAPRGALPGRPRLAGRARLRVHRRTTWSRCAGWCSTETGLLPHANAGALYEDELAALRPVAPSQGMMIETLRGDLPAHRGSPDKTPERRLATLEAAGRLGIPFTTGILVGIGEDRADRVAALEAIAAAHRRHGHVQEVIVQNFLPKPGTAMHQAPPCPPDEHLDAIALARLILPPDVHVQAPPNLADDFGVLLDAGIDDWGGVSPVTADHVNPERPWPALDRLRAVTEARGFALAPRLTVYPDYVAAPDRWLDPGLVFPVGDRADAEGLGRDDPGSVFPERTLENAKAGTGAEIVLTGVRSTAWYSGADAEPPTLIPGPRGAVRGRVAEVLAGVRAGQQVGEDEIVDLFARPGPRGGGGGRAGRRAAPRGRGRHGHLRPQPQHQLHERVHVQVPVLRVLQGPALAQPAGHALPAHAGRHRRAVPGGVGAAAPPRCACRAASTPTSTATTTSTSPGP